MKIVCPNCAAEYTLPDSMFGAEGKKVKCASCAKVWHAVPVEEANDGIDDIMAAVPADVPAAEEPLMDSADREAAYAAMTEDALEETAQSDGENVDGAIESGPVATAGERKHRLVRLKGARSGPSLLSKVLPPVVRIGTPVSIAAGLVLLVLAVPFRDQVVQAVPDLAKIYETVGLNVNIRGITFSEVTAERSVVAGLTILKIEAAMENVEDRTVPVGAVRLALVDADGMEMFTWRVDPPVESLEPGASAEIVSELTAPPANVTSIAVRFLQPGERLPAQIL
ncbi:MAG: zinc-ribbon domain-containing protein [Cohaesibacteraceae bacterium]